MLFIWIVLGLFCTIKYVIYLTNVRCRSFKNLTGQTILITGGNSGLGLELAKNVASRGCTTIIADKTDATETVKKLIKESNNTNIFYEYVDFTSFKSVRIFAEKFKSKYHKLNILVNNAGVGTALGKTEDGLEATMQINYFSHFLLTHLLLDILLKTTQGRIIFTSSLGAYVSNLNEKNLNYDSNKNQFHQTFFLYTNSKVALAMMSRTLARKLKGTGITTNAHHPGLVKTNIIISMPKKGISFQNLCLQFFFWLWGKDTDEGVQTMLHLVTSDELEDKSGKFFIECMPVWQPPMVCNDKLRKDIWNLSEEYVKLKPEEKVDAILHRL